MRAARDEKMGMKSGKRGGGARAPVTWRGAGSLIPKRQIIRRWKKSNANPSHGSTRDVERVEAQQDLFADIPPAPNEREYDVAEDRDAEIVFLAESMYQYANWSQGSSVPVKPNVTIEDEQHEAPPPVELSRGLVGAREVDADRWRKARRMRKSAAPTVQRAYQPAEPHLIGDDGGAEVGRGCGRPVVDHQEDAGRVSSRSSAKAMAPR